MTQQNPLETAAPVITPEEVDKLAQQPADDTSWTQNFAGEGWGKDGIIASDNDAKSKTADKQGEKPAIHELVLAGVEAVAAAVGGIKDLQLKDEGRIKTCKLPDGWFPEAKAAGWEERSRSTGFHPAADKGAHLVFFDRNQDLSPAGAKMFAGLLSDKLDLNPSKNSADAAKIEAMKKDGLVDLLGSMASSDVFRLDKLSTKEINGQKVLVVDGQYMSGGRMSHCVLFPKDGSHTRAQEVFFSAEQASFKQHSPAAKATIDSIEFHPPKVAERPAAKHTDDF